MAKNVYIYTFPVVENNKYLTGLPFNLFKNEHSLTSQAIISPNVDTLYSKAVIDLRDGDVQLFVPKMDRFYVLQFVDLYTRNFHYIDSDTKQQSKYIISCKNTEADIYSPTAICLILGRVYVKTTADLPRAISLQDQIHVVGPSRSSTSKPLSHPFLRTIMPKEPWILEAIL